MNTRLFTAPAAFIGFLFAGCTKEDATPVLTWEGQGVSIQATLTGTRHSTTGEMLHGDLHVVGTSGALTAVDLRCIGIASGPTASKKIYVSSFIDVIPSGYRANSKGIVDVAVYWSMTGLKQQDSLQLLRSAKIVVEKASKDPCFELEK